MNENRTSDLRENKSPGYTLIGFRNSQVIDSAVSPKTLAGVPKRNESVEKVGFGADFVCRD
jgi:hypothetical protein